MSKDTFKTRLEIAKSKIFKKNLYKDKDPPSSIGTAFKMSTELVSAVVLQVLGKSSFNANGFACTADT